MSTGQTQLLAVARAILQLQSFTGIHKNQPDDPYYDNPTRQHVMPILLLDEATSSLDPGSASAIHAIIRQEFTDRGHTVVDITYGLSSLTMEKSMRPGPERDAVVLLSRGKVEKFGRVEDILGMSTASLRP